VRGGEPIANTDPSGKFFGATLGCFFGFSLRVRHLVALGAVLLGVLGALWYFGIGRGTVDNANAVFQTDGPRVAAATITIETAAGQGKFLVNGRAQGRLVSPRGQAEVRRIIDDSLSQNVPGFRRGSVTINFVPAPGPDPMARVQNEALIGRTAPGGLATRVQRRLAGLDHVDPVADLRQSHPRRVPGKLTVPQVAARLNAPVHWVYDRIHNGTIHVTRDPDTNLYLFPDTPNTIARLRQLRQGRLKDVRI
jgi:hypothetical protein